MRNEQFSCCSAACACEREVICVSWVTYRGDAQRKQKGAAEVIAHVLVRIPETGHQCLARAVDHIRSRRNLRGSRIPNRSNFSAFDDHSLILGKARAIDE